MQHWSSINTDLLYLSLLLSHFEITSSRWQELLVTVKKIQNYHFLIINSRVAHNFGGTLLAVFCFVFLGICWDRPPGLTRASQKTVHFANYIRINGDMLEICWKLAPPILKMRNTLPNKFPIHFLKMFTGFGRMCRMYGVLTGSGEARRAITTYSQKTKTKDRQCTP